MAELLNDEDSKNTESHEDQNFVHFQVLYDSENIVCCELCNLLRS